MLKAIIFDFDGVISNSEPTHFVAFQRVLSEEGIDISQADYFQKYLGMDDKGAFKTAFHDAGRVIETMAITTLIARKASYFDKLAQEIVTVYPDAINFITGVADRFPLIPLAINSGALRVEIEPVLARMGLAKHFSLIVSAEDINHCKPDPEGYLLALSRLNLKHTDLLARPKECLVIEDSVSGVRSAIAAGMTCVAITNTYPASALAHATSIVTSLTELNDKLLAQLFA